MKVTPQTTVTRKNWKQSCTPMQTYTHGIIHFSSIKVAVHTCALMLDKICSESENNLSMLK